MFVVGFFFFKQKTAYEMRISDWSSDVCSSDLDEPDYLGDRRHHPGADRGVHPDGLLPRIDRRHLSPILDDARDLDRLLRAARADADPGAVRDAAETARPDRAQGADRSILRPLLRPLQRQIGRAHV